MTFNLKKPETWNEDYWEKIIRNIGYISISEQDIIKNTKIAVLGVGGLGGPLAEQLIRSGNENLVICDHDKFELSNMNRQICTDQDMGAFKVDILENYYKNINPDIKIKTYKKIDITNISEILENVKIVALTLDDPIKSILIARYCRKEGIPIIESWAFPYLFAWWFTEESDDYETCYGLNSQKDNLEDISENKTISNIFTSLLPPLLSNFPGLKMRLNREIGVANEMSQGKISIRSFTPIVRLSASYIAFDIIFAGILNVKEKILAPEIKGYDYFQMKEINFKIR